MSVRVELAERDTAGVPVRIYQVLGHEPLCERLCALASDERARDPAGQQYQGDNTWHSADDLHGRVELAPLRDAFDAALDDAWARVAWTRAERPWRYTAMWSNIAGHGSYVAPHAHWGHAGSIIGGVYYAQAPRGSGALRLFSPDQHLTTVGPVELPTLAPFSRPEWVDIEPRAGQIVLIPSWVGHCVRTNISLRERISWTFLASVAGFEVHWPAKAELPERTWAPPRSGPEHSRE